MAKHTAEEISKWDVAMVCNWLKKEGFSDDIVSSFQKNEVDGFVLLRLSDDELRNKRMGLLTIGSIIRLSDSIRCLKSSPSSVTSKPHLPDLGSVTESSDFLDGHNERRYAKNLKPEKLKTLIAVAYSAVVLYICAFIMTIVNDRVPDMEKYPPLPDLFLDNMPYIPWAFSAAEFMGAVLTVIFLLVAITHKHRYVIFRRFFSLMGTLYLLRGFCMLITSLSVPCKFFHCKRQEATDLLSKMKQALTIVAAGGMSVNGVRYCGDYMFSGHTTLLTLVNLFIDEYSHKDYPVVKTAGWVLNLFGIFFIMAGHEHYSIDVFIAFYLTTRLFLYYHTLADNHAGLRYDDKKVRTWFPLFYYFESQVDGAVPYIFEYPVYLSSLLPWKSRAVVQ